MAKKIGETRVLGDKVFYFTGKNWSRPVMYGHQIYKSVREMVYANRESVEQDPRKVWAFLGGSYQGKEFRYAAAEEIARLLPVAPCGPALSTPAPEPLSGVTVRFADGAEVKVQAPAGYLVTIESPQGRKVTF